MAKTEPNPVGRSSAFESSSSTPSAPATSPLPTGAQAPSVGRIVHYQPSGESVAGIKPRAAIVADVGEGGRVTLHVFPPSGDSVVVREVEYAESPAPGRWNWPPRV